MEPEKSVIRSLYTLSKREKKITNVNYFRAKFVRYYAENGVCERRRQRRWRRRHRT